MSGTTETKMSYTNTDKIGDYEKNMAAETTAMEVHMVLSIIIAGSLFYDEGKYLTKNLKSWSKIGAIVSLIVLAGVAYIQYSKVTKLGDTGQTKQADGGDEKYSYKQLNYDTLGVRTLVALHLLLTIVYAMYVFEVDMVKNLVGKTKAETVHKSFWTISAAVCSYTTYLYLDAKNVEKYKSNHKGNYGDKKHKK